MHTNSTPNYELPQFVGTDKPTWLGDVNGAMLAIDNAIAGVDSKATTADGKADLATTAASNAASVAADAATAAADAATAAASASANASSAITTAGNAATAASAAQSTADGAATAAATAQSTAEGAATAASAAATAASAVDTKVGDLANLETTVKTSIVAAINEVAGGSGGSVSVTADGVKTHNALFTELFQLADIAKVTEKTVLTMTASGGTSVYNIAFYDNTAIRFSMSNANSTSAYVTYIGVGATSFGYRAEIASGTTVTDFGAQIAANGAVLTIKY